jgi:hypothetical protein
MASGSCVARPGTTPVTNSGTKSGIRFENVLFKRLALREHRGRMVRRVGDRCSGKWCQALKGVSSHPDPHMIRRADGFLNSSCDHSQACLFPDELSEIRRTCWHALVLIHHIHPRHSFFHTASPIPRLSIRRRNPPPSIQIVGGRNHFRRLLWFIRLPTIPGFDINLFPSEAR